MRACIGDSGGGGDGDGDGGGGGVGMRDANGRYSDGAMAMGVAFDGCAKPCSRFEHIVNSFGRARVAWECGS